LEKTIITILSLDADFQEHHNIISRGEL
jgi:hypothetical protein